MCVALTHTFNRKVCRLPLGKKVVTDDVALHPLPTFFRMREETTKKQTQQSPPSSEETPSAILPLFHHHEIMPKSVCNVCQYARLPTGMARGSQTREPFGMRWAYECAHLAHHQEVEDDVCILVGKPDALETQQHVGLVLRVHLDPP